MTIRVLHILGPLRPSGMERMLVSASKHFEGEGVVGWVLGQGREHPYLSDLQAAGYQVRVSSPVGQSLAAARELRRMVQDEKIQIIHIHTEGNYLRTVLACRYALGRRGAIVRTVHSIFAAHGMWRARRLFQAVIADRFVQVLIAPSPDVAKQERTVFRHMQVVFNWIDDMYFVLQEQRLRRERSHIERQTALIVGNCSHIKNHELALEAVQRSGHTVIHLGDERGASIRERQILSDLADSQRLKQRGVRQPFNALLEADCFLMSSRHEGMGVALAEALVGGVPAIVSDVPGLQWAKGLPGVTMLVEDEDIWADALRNKIYAKARPATVDLPDFTAARGAFEYAELYRIALEAESSLGWRDRLSARRS